MNKATKSQKTDNKTAKIAGILVLLAVVILIILPARLRQQGHGASRTAGNRHGHFLRFRRRGRRLG